VIYRKTPRTNKPNPMVIKVMKIKVRKPKKIKVNRMHLEAWVTCLKTLNELQKKVRTKIQGSHLEEQEVKKIS
jgi:hypothetical protein